MAPGTQSWVGGTKFYWETVWCDTENLVLLNFYLHKIPSFMFAPNNSVYAAECIAGLDYLTGILNQMTLVV